MKKLLLLISTLVLFSCAQKHDTGAASKECVFAPIIREAQKQYPNYHNNDLAKKLFYQILNGREKSIKDLDSLQVDFIKVMEVENGRYAALFEYEATVEPDGWEKCYTLIVGLVDNNRGAELHPGIKYRVNGVLADWDSIDHFTWHTADLFLGTYILDSLKVEAIKN